MEDLAEEHSKSRSQSSSPSRSLWWSQTGQIINDIVADAPLNRIVSKSLVALYLIFATWLIWQLLSLTGITASSRNSGFSRGESTLHNYFSDFEGYSECNIRALELYILPSQDAKGFYDYGTFCHSRTDLLKALSEGGRIGFDAPYQPRDCNYRWFHPVEICNILTRFDSLVFAGDDSLLPVYGGLNVLLRQDLAFGALDATSMSADLRSQCSCNNQYIRQDCLDHFIKDSEKLAQSDGHGRIAPYTCNRPRHAFLHLNSASMDSPTLSRFQQLVPHAPKSSYRPISIVTSMSPSRFTSTEASSFLLSTMKLADDTARNTPMLWIGPTAAGHIDIKGRKGNQEIWDFDRKMAEVAVENDIEVLGMWNLTVQAGSWDGMRFGERVGIVQAMMVVNWLSRLESS